jgi:small subunit ribosomal protein S28e
MESEPVKARVTQLLGRTGSRGGITQVKVILISGKEADKRHLIRNVKGPVRIGDVLELMESEREARRLRGLSITFNRDFLRAEALTGKGVRVRIIELIITFTGLNRVLYCGRECK